MALRDPSARAPLTDGRAPQPRAQLLDHLPLYLTKTPVCDLIHPIRSYATVCRASRPTNMRGLVLNRNTGDAVARLTSHVTAVMEHIVARGKVSARG